jgi:hypothetical protein
VQFQTSKNGYDKQEVDMAMGKLNAELQVWKERALKAESDYIKIKERENEIKRNGENIALALTAAIEKAKQIETSSKNVYKLKIQQISILYDRWEMLLNEILTKYPMLEDSHNIQKMLLDFKKNIENVINKNYEHEGVIKQVENDSMRQLLLKMSKYNQTAKNTAQIERKDLAKDLKTGQSELKKMEDRVMIKPITNLTLDKSEGFETLADKFLTEQDDNPQYSKFMSKQLDNTAYPTTNESGFNLKEAVNPKDDLDEIMKSFDFFTNRDDE